uniref:Uncharacterized protein n=1 Tax=Timema cristinae TaxID=61476 RepID=A0A7R9H8L7_TIMCR|nr:unnamed protein product [Timema cristinae]
MKNEQVQDFNLTDEDIEDLNALDKGRKGRMFGGHVIPGSYWSVSAHCDVEGFAERSQLPLLEEHVQLHLKVGGLDTCRAPDAFDLARVEVGQTNGLCPPCVHLCLHSLK